MSRTLILLGLVQALAVILGASGLAIVLRHHGYPAEPFHAGSNFFIYHWSPLALFLRHYGFLLLGVPLLWVVFAAVAERRARYGLSFGFWMILGTIIPLTIIAIFFYAIFHPYIAVAN